MVTHSALAHVSLCLLHSRGEPLLRKPSKPPSNLWASTFGQASVMELGVGTVDCKHTALCKIEYYLVANVKSKQAIQKACHVPSICDFVR